MSGKEAGIKITLDNKTFIAQLTSTENAVKASGSKMGKGIDDGIKAGIKGGGEAVKGLLSSIKNGVQTFSGFGSMLGTVALIKEAQGAEGAFKKVAFQIRAGTGELVPFRGMLESAQATSIKWGKSIDDLGKAMSDIYSETGDKDFAGGALEAIAVTARASKEPIELLSTLSGSLNEKFGVTSDELGDVLANVLSLGNKGGITIDELAGKIGVIGSVAREAGLTGKAGFTQMVSLLNVADDGGKNLKKNLSAIGGVLEDLGIQKNRVKIMAKLGIDASAVKGKDVTGMIGEVLKKTGGSKDKLAIAFEGEKLAFMIDLGKRYSSAFAEQTGSIKEKTEAGLAAYNDALAKAGKSNLSYSQVQEIASKSMNSGPAKLAAAMEKMKASFTKPEITGAIGQLADGLPKLAGVITGVVDFAAAHPILAGGALVGGTAIRGAAGGVAGVGMEALSASMKTALGGTAAAAGATAGAGVGEGLAAAAPKAGSAFAGVAAPLLANALAGAAVVSIGLAADQATKLYTELTTGKGWAGGATQKDKSGSSIAWRTFLHDIGAMDDKTFQDMNDKASGIDRSGYDSAADWEKGLKAKDARQAHSADEAAAGMSFSAADIVNAGGSSNDASVPEFLRRGPERVARGGGGGAASSKENAQLLNDMLRGAPLAVKISNPEDVRGGGAGGTGGPVPGYVDRQ